MIISASRRTDIPAFYAEWFIRRIRAGYCLVPNPFNTQQVQRVSLLPEHVDAIVFWTRNPRPIFSHLAELDERGYRYYFQYTLMDNPAPIDPASPHPPASVATFQELAHRIGPQGVIWRYDPILISDLTPPAWHMETYARLANSLAGATRQCVVSILDAYPKTQKRMQALANQGVQLYPANPEQPWFEELMSAIAALAAKNNMQITSCAEEMNLKQYGITPGKCIDDHYLARTFGIQVNPRKDPSQRKACGCVVSKDIGVYDSCLFGCVYCYATTSFERARRRHTSHDPHSPFLMPLPQKNEGI